MCFTATPASLFGMFVTMRPSVWNYSTLPSSQIFSIRIAPNLPNKLSSVAGKHIGRSGK